jgi:hypothetical protein
MTRGARQTALLTNLQTEERVGTLNDAGIKTEGLTYVGLEWDVERARVQA